jgi:ankyrin repeat protein
LPVIKYLLKVLPESISAKGEDRLTPLLSAVKLGRLEAVKVLVANGADQSKRHEITYANLLHAALFESPKAPELEKLLDILDKDAVAQMFCERTHHASWSESRTPLHAWLVRTLSSGHNDQYGPGLAYDSADEVIAVLRLLLSCSGGRDLNVIDSAGDTALHMLARTQADPVFLLALLEAIPRELALILLHRENAVGATPLEVAHDKFLASFVIERHDYAGQMSSLTVNNWPVTAAKEFVETVNKGRKEAPMQTRITTNKNETLKRAEETLAALDTFLKGEVGKRQLVSLNEANDVARRIGHGFQKQRYPVQLIKPATETGEAKNGQPAKPDPMLLSFNTHGFANSSWRVRKNDDDDAQDAEIDAMINQLLP